MSIEYIDKIETIKSQHKGLLNQYRLTIATISNIDNIAPAVFNQMIQSGAILDIKSRNFRMALDVINLICELEKECIQGLQK